MGTSREELSPLDQIRLVESEMSRRLVAAREAAEETVAGARSLAVQRKNEAFQAGIREGEALYKHILTRAEEEAGSIVAQAKKRADKLHLHSTLRMDAAVQAVLERIIGSERKG